MKNPACLQIGWVITIPSAGGSTAVAASGPSTYTVQSGDSLAKIAKKLGVDFNALIAANKKDRPCLAAATPCPLQVGWVLTVPGGTGAPVVDNPAATVAEYFAAINARDVNRFKATIHPDLLRDSAQADKDLQSLFILLDFLQIKYEVIDLRTVEQSADFAIVAYTVKGTSPLMQDPSEGGPFSGQFLLAKYQGQWKSVADSLADLEEPVK